MKYEDIPYSPLQHNVYADIASGKPVVNVHTYDQVESGLDIAVQTMVAVSAAWERYLALPSSVRHWERGVMDKALKVLEKEEERT